MTSGRSPTMLTLGTAQLGMAYGVANTQGTISRDAAFAILDAAFARGVRSIDTAPAYGDAEERVGAWLSARPAARDDVVVCTKLPSLGESLATGDVVAAVREAVERSLRRVGRVDHYLVHDVGDLRRHAGALVDALVREQRAGHVGAIGCSVYTPDDVRLVLEQRALTSIQVPLNLVDQRLIASGLLHELAARGVTVFARSAYLQGLFALDADQLPPRVAHCEAVLRALNDVCATFGVRPLDVALAWVRSNAGVASVVVGVESTAQLEDNVAAAMHAVPPGLGAALAQRFADVDVRVIDPSRWKTA